MTLPAVTPPRPIKNLARVTVARRELCTSLAIRSVLAVVGAIICIIAAVMLARSGVVDHPFPIAMDGTSGDVTSYSGPLWAAAIGLGAIAGLLLVSALTDGWRRHVMARCVREN